MACRLFGAKALPSRRNFTEIFIQENEFENNVFPNNGHFVSISMHE